MLLAIQKQRRLEVDAYEKSERDAAKLAGLSFDDDEEEGITEDDFDY